MTAAIKRFTVAALVCLATLGGTSAQATSLLDQFFSEFERQIIERYLAQHAHEGQYDDGKQAKKDKKDKKDKKAPPGLAKRKTLPPGLAKRETLPPGLAKRDFPPDLQDQLPPPQPGTQRILVDGNAVLIEVATRQVLDVIEGVLANQ